MTESLPGNDVIISKNVKETTHPTADGISAVDPPNDMKMKKQKKKSGAFGIFRAALFMLRKRSGAKKYLAKQDGSAAINSANWTKLVGSVRPLHLQDAVQSPPHSPQAAATADEIGEIIPPANNANWTDLVGSARPLHLQENAQSPPPAATTAREIGESILPARNNANRTNPVGSMCLLHHQINAQSPPPAAATANAIGEIIPPANTSANWTNPAGSMCLLHHQINAQSPPPAALMAEQIGENISQASPAANNNANWTDLLGSVRLLHLQKTTAQSPPPSSPESPAASSSRGTMSQYSSAVSLLDLDNSSDEEEEDPDEVFDALTGDEMIDAKAEEFIAQFYKELQLQRTARAHHHHHRHHHSRGI